VSRAQDERRLTFERYKKNVEKRGKPFFPYAMFHDTVMSLVVVSVIIGLAIVWKYSAGESPEDSGVLGVLYAEEADPGTTSFIPRPDWYFYFLFYLLRIFKWPDSVILGTVGIPTIALMILIALPFIDRRPERRLLRRPVALVALVITAVSMGVLTYKGATVREFLGGDAPAIAEKWISDNNLPQNVKPGAVLVAANGCLNCHTYSGDGTSNVGAPDLTDIGSQEGKSVDYFMRYVANPREFGNTVMPAFGQDAGGRLTEQELRQIAEFLAASKGG
jgi:quinol---cytochrome c reductase cytochrome c subunit, bacillus type